MKIKKGAAAARRVEQPPVKARGNATVWACLAIGFLCCLLFTACQSDYTPKPKAYPRVNFPAHSYTSYNPASCPFKFDIPVYARVDVDTVFFGQRIDQPCWLNLQFPQYNGTVNLTYKAIGDSLNFDKLVNDAYTLTYKHTKRADYINEIKIENDHGVDGILYDVGGAAASNVQFFLSDTTHHFIRGSLYFNNPPNVDSMAPVVTFVKEDLRHMLQTFQWK